VSYELDLPKDAKVYPVFYISLLELADPKTLLQEIFHFEIKEENVFEVEKILRQRGQKYLIK